MENGYYRKKPIQWYKYEVDVFIPHLFSNGWAGCGANTLALLTGIPPNYIQNTNKQNPNHWKDTFMIKFLKKHGFKVIPLTKCDATNCSDGYIADKINNRHVLMVSQLMGKNNASWTVIHNELMYHNFETIAFKGYSLVNNPSLTAYVVFHPTWKSDNWKCGKNIHQIYNNYHQLR